MAPRKHSVAGVPGRDKTLPRVPLTVHGREYFLVFDFNSIAVAEELTGLDLLTKLDLQNLNARTYRALLFSTLLKENPEITVEDAGALISLETLPAITVALVHAWTGSQPEVVKDKEDAPNPPEEEPELNS